MSKKRFKLIPAVYIFLRKDDQVLLLERANTGYQDGMYSVPAGHIDGDELATQAACREAKEEINIIIQPHDLSFAHVSHRLGESPEDERVDFFFEVWEWEGEVTNREPHKCADLTWCSIDKLPKNIIPYVKLVLEKTLAGERYSEYQTEPQ